ncbi:copper-binding protein [Microvirga pudoricolor]|uniref:copper-binding protein n=1 Tax=Microvirga pudoricolor TaxID=2778729 RepID=UPI00194EE548|nr:copper-binding protein [Microvirga pudoricolor]MBM6595376.1 copper-binding protein [Microvirga pudoricolor]
MKRMTATLTAVGALLAVVAIGPHQLAQAQPAKGASAAYERVREVMDDRFKDMKLAGDPDKDFAALLIAHHEDLIFLARTQLEHGADEHLRQVAQKILDEQQKQISELKEWQVRNRQADYRAKLDQPPHASGPLDQKGASAPAPQAQAAAPVQPAAQPTTASQLPTVSGTVEKVDVGAGKITLDHGPIPNLNMDAMTMVFRAQDPSLLQGVKAGDKIRFQADRVNGQISVVRIDTGRAQSAPAGSAAQPAAAANLPTVSGTVEKVDAGAGKITLDHGAIPNLNMDAMTMVFRAQDPALLKGMKAGDKVQFQADRVNGQISVISIKKAR